MILLTESAEGSESEQVKGALSEVWVYLAVSQLQFTPPHSAL